MPEDKRKIIEYIVFSICLGAIFFITGYYSDLENLILVSSFFPIAFIPIVLLSAFKKSYVKNKGVIYLVAIISSAYFYDFIISLKPSEIISDSSLTDIHLTIILLSFVVTILIRASSYNLIRLFGIQTDLRINEKIKTISVPLVQNNVHTAKNLIAFFLEDILLFKYYEKINNDTYQYQRNEREYILVNYLEDPNQSNLLISFFMFYDSQDGVDAFKSRKINSLALLLERVLGGNIVPTSDETMEYFSNYFLKYAPIINRVSKYFSENKINISDIKNPLILSILLILVFYVGFNYKNITGFILSFDTDKLINIMAIVVGVPASLYYTLKIIGKAE